MTDAALQIMRQQKTLDASAKLTPMMEQFFDVKSRYPDALLFFRLGDFYELFYDDALTASEELNITLTGRAAGQENKAPMCGVPFHSADGYILRLIRKGYKVAICEQTEDPKLVKGLVKRDVIRVITPGTVMSESGTDAAENNFLALFYGTDEVLAAIFVEVSTGEAVWERVKTDDGYTAMYDALAVYRPSEVVTAGDTVLPEEVRQYIESQFDHTPIMPFALPAGDTAEETVRKGRERLHLPPGISHETALAAGYVMRYLETTLMSETEHIHTAKRFSSDSCMILDTASLRHLEVTRNLRDGGTKGTLLRVLDSTKTPMGARLLKQWLERPLTDVHAIEYRQYAVEECLSRPTEQAALRDFLASVFDFERIAARVETGSVSPRDFVSLRESLRILPDIKEAVAVYSSSALADIASRIDSHEEMCALLNRSIAESPALTLRDGRVIRDGYSEELDELRKLSTNGRESLAEMESRVRAETGLRLKTGYNKVFGYYFEVTRSNLSEVPDYFIRKQTLANAERYITPELKEFEIKILSANERSVAIEQELYREVCEAVKTEVRALQKTARALAELDVFASMALAAYEGKYIRPTLRNDGRIVIRDGRHPVIESFLKREVFVPNDTVLNHDEEEFLLITGPNMAGKSTYMRQVAVLMIMAQAGSFIPAREAVVSPVARIFTRVGASDDISTGQSTFMVEMTEVAYILENATKNSLVILDEIGRGTSTFDGLSIAQAVVEHICRHVHAKTLFATHYHELIAMESEYPMLKNYTVAVKEKGKDVAFLRRIVRGGADRSYGIHVARLAGLPTSVLKRAEVILEDMERGKASVAALSEGAAGEADIVEVARGTTKGAAYGNLFGDTVTDALKRLDIMSMTPIEAMNELYRLQEAARKADGE